MRQSSGAEKGVGDKRANSGRVSVESLSIRMGFAGALVVFASLWFQRHLIAEASTKDIIVFAGMALGVAAILTAVVTANVVVPSISDRTGDLVDVLRSVAQGDLTRAPRTAALGADGEEVVSAARSALVTLRTYVADARAATREAVARSQDLALHGSAAMSAAQRQSEGASSAALQGATLVELARAAHDDVSRIAKGAARLVDEAHAQRARETTLRKLSQQSHAHLHVGTGALDALASEVRASADELGALAGASEEIRSFVTLVRKMARQSKLLALNAAMEAARAGEQGSGFAVVASEVRRLARSSNEAADRTDQLVTDVLERVERVRGASERAVESVRQVRQASASGLESLRHLAHAADEGLKAASVEEHDVESVTAAGDALVLRLDQLAREADSLASLLRDAATASSTQQGRLQELTTSSNALTRTVTKAASAVGGLRVEKESAAAPATGAVDVALAPNVAAT